MYVFHIALAGTGMSWVHDLFYGVRPKKILFLKFYAEFEFSI